MEFDLHPAPQLHGGRMVWDASRAPEVLAAFRAITAVAPEDLTCWFELLHFPGGSPLVAIDTTYLGPADDGRDLLRRLDGIDGLLSDTRAVLPVAELGEITADPTAPSPGLPSAGLLTDLDDTVADALLAEPIDPLLSVQIRHLGGALARPTDTAAGHLDEPYGCYQFGIPSGADRAAAVRARQQRLGAALAPRLSGRTPYTLLAPGQTAADAFPADTHARLREIKKLRDPQGVLRANYPID